MNTAARLTYEKADKIPHDTTDVYVVCINERNKGSRNFSPAFYV